MSQVRLTLRPPPNVDFIHGFPGIPPGAPDRQQAAVKGALEVRAAPAVKAKWVRIELRKVEMLPGGGLNNTYYDFVGSSPISLWAAKEGEEWSDLDSLDFPFSIRIPESIPPTLTLENRAGIKYELLASVCTKGKRNFLRRRKQNIISTQSPITIDKHELHSTWPVYCQHEAREIKQEGVTLIVERNHTCYGPGDRVSVFATVKSDAMHTIILRGFELTLKESMIFRPGRPPGRQPPGYATKKIAPQSFVTIVSENKLPVNATLFGGMTHKSELTCQISPSHTTTTLNAARHIDITYVLSIKALMGTGTHLIMDLPIILSNWQRNVSQEAIRRIGPTPSLSLLPPNSSSVMSVEPILGGRVPPLPSSPLSQTFGKSDASATHGRNDSFSNTYTGSATKPEGIAKVSEHKTTGSKSSIDEWGARTTGGSSAITTTNTGGTGKRSGTAEDKSDAQAPKPANTGTTNGRVWPTAEEEKQKLYNLARQKAEVTQSLAAKAQAQVAQAQVVTSPLQNVTSPQRSTPWPTAEEEKTRLFTQAQAAARKAQGLDYAPEPAAASSAAPAPIQAPRTSPQTSTTAAPQYRTADQEKAALKRYYEAKQAVDRSTQAVNAFDSVSGPAPVNGLAGPVAYDSLYPSSGQSSSPPPASDLPPPFESAPVKDARTALEEKMRLKRAYEAQDAAAAGIDRANANATPPYGAPPPFQASSVPSPSASAEKELLRRKFQAQDAAAGSPQPPPPRQGSINSRGPRPTPATPLGAKVLTAAEEKALLKAKYDADNRSASPKPHINGNVSTSPSPSPSTPPPLMPRPPVSYIQETQEEDARVSRFAMDGMLPPDEVYLNGGITKSPSGSIRVPGPPPQLPNKLEGE